MIVKYLWAHTSKRVHKHRAGTYTNTITYWQGWFLFGIIPLYIKTTSKEHFRD